jgi:hypothetical protein
MRRLVVVTNSLSTANGARTAPERTTLLIIIGVHGLGAWDLWYSTEPLQGHLRRIFSCIICVWTVVPETGLVGFVLHLNGTAPGGSAACHMSEIVSRRQSTNPSCCLSSYLSCPRRFGMPVCAYHGRGSRLLSPR